MHAIGLRICLLVILLFFNVSLAFCQGLRELKVGDTFPDLPLGTVLDNTGKISDNFMGKYQFSEFKGKLIILDFWDSFCSTCIEGFEKMKDLQAQFGDKIQILLVNPYEDEKQIRERIKKFEKKELNKIFPPSLPILINAKELYSLFPPKGEIGYHAWIDKDFVVRLRGIFINTTKIKIQEFLEKNIVDFIKDGNNFNQNTSLLERIDSSMLSILKFNSLLTVYSDLIGNPWGGGIVKNRADSARLIERSTFANLTVLDLYKNCLERKMIDSQLIWGNKIKLSVSDTLLYSDDVQYFSGTKTDQTQRSSRYCYELIVPLGLSDSLKGKIMLDDLNRYFNLILEAEGNLVKVQMPCYVLVRTSNVDKLKTVNTESHGRTIVRNGKEMMLYTNLPLKKVINLLISESKNPIFKTGELLLDETGYTGNVDMLLPNSFKGDLKNIDDLRLALRAYDLDIKIFNRNVTMLHLYEKKLYDSN